MKNRSPIAALFLLSGLLGCGAKVDDSPLKPRRAAVLVEGCTVDDGQMATLSAAETNRVLDEVVLRCLSLKADGSIAPTSGSSRQALKDLTAGLRGQGYQVSLALTAQTADGEDFEPEKLLEILNQSGSRSRATTELATFAATVNFIDLALPPLPDRGRDVLKQWAGEIHSALPQSTRLGLFAPPSSMQPSDVPGGGAADLATLGASFDRIRLMTLDYSFDQLGGPTTDPVWIQEVAAFAMERSRLAGSSLDIALPLYGVDFSSLGNFSVSYLEAAELAQTNTRQILRAPGRTLYFYWTDSDEIEHEIWFDDAVSLVDYQREFDASIDPGIGILYYGLGSEDPALFPQLSRLR